MKYFIASLGGFQFGYAIGIMAGAILFLTPHFDLPLHLQGILVSALLMGALPGAAIAGPLSNRLGRKRSQQLIGLLFLIGSLILCFSGSISTVMIGRVIQGLAVGAIAVVAPMYIAEISPRERRGHFVSFYQLAVTIGILAAYALNLILAPHWQWMFGLGAIPALIHIIGLKFLPDSLHHELSHSGWSGIPMKPLLIAVFLNVFQQITGINSIIYFAPMIFLNAGFDTPLLALMPPILVAAVNILFSYVALLLLDRLGRKPLLLSGITTMAIALVLLIGAFLTTTKWLATTSILIYIAGFAVGLGPIPQLVTSEIFPQKYRAHGMSIGLMANWIFNFVVVFTFLDLSKRFSHAATFGFYALFSLVALYFSWRYIPETKGLQLK